MFRKRGWRVALDAQGFIYLHGHDTFSDVDASKDDLGAHYRGISQSQRVPRVRADVTCRGKSRPSAFGHKLAVHCVPTVRVPSSCSHSSTISLYVFSCPRGRACTSLCKIILSRI